MAKVSLQFLTRSNRRAGVVLCFHGLSHPSDRREPELLAEHDAELFERDLCHISGAYRIVRATEFTRAIAERRRGQPFPLAITFDDDLRSHRRLAVPALERVGLRATFFLCGASLSEPFSFWWERLDRALAAGVDVEAEVPALASQIPASASRAGQVEQIRELMTRLPLADRDEIAAELSRVGSPDPIEAGLRADDVRAIAKAGHEIGFHTLSHQSLVLLDDDALGRALTEGRGQLEAVYGAPITSISYPYGVVDTRVASAAREAGYLAGFSGEAIAADASTDELRIGRIVPSFDSAGHLDLRLVYAIARGIMRDGRSEFSAQPTAAAHGRDRGLVMLCDVDLGFPDATRTHTVEVARGFASAGLDVDLVARGPDQRIGGVRYFPASGSETQRGVRLWSITRRTVTLLWRRRRSARRFYARFKWTCIPSMAVARALGYRVVTQVDGAGGNSEASHVRHVADVVSRSSMGRLSHGVLAVTPEIKGVLVEGGIRSEQITVVANGVDTEFFTPLRRDDAIARAGLDPAYRYAIFCGGFHEWSDFDTLLKAFKIVSGSEPAARLLLVGDGPERDRILQLTQELQLSDVVIMTGLVHERERVRDYLGASTVALLPYRAEMIQATSASPVKLNEYLASGRAVVTADVPGVTELVHAAGAGTVVAGSADAVAAAILELLNPEYADELGAAGRRFAVDRLSWRGVIERTLPLFGI